MPTPRRTPGDTTRGVVTALSISLACLAAGCHGIPAFPILRSPCPGCHAAPHEPCGCTPDAISAGYHETRWRSIRPLQTFHAGVQHAPVPVHSTIGTTHPTTRTTTSPEIDVPNPDNGSLSLIAPQSHEEPVPAIAASLDDELSRYFFDLETPPGESDAAAGESDAARVNGRNIARNR